VIVRDVVVGFPGAGAASDFASAISSLEFDSPSAAEASLRDLAGRSNAGPYKTLAALYRGNLASDAGRYEEAVAAYDEFLGRHPRLPAPDRPDGKAAALEKSAKATEAAAALDLAAAIDAPTAGRP